MAGDVLTQPNRLTLNPTALPVAEAARLLSAAGGTRVTSEMIHVDVDAGAISGRPLRDGGRRRASGVTTSSIILQMGDLDSSEV